MKFTFMKKGYSITVKEIKEVLKNKKYNQILDFDIDVFMGNNVDKISVDVYCRDLDTKEEKLLIKMHDDRVDISKEKE